MAKKQPIYKGLAELSVQIDDRSLNSTDYFRITKMPSEFTAGVNTIKFKGNPTVFLNESIVEIEILDSNGEVVYHEIGLDLESEQQSAVINVFINQDTAPGIGTIYICGTINKDANGNALEPKTLNLRWSAPINIDISKRNSVEILYERLPVVEISTTSGAYTNLKYPSNNRIVSNSITIPSGKLSYLNYNNQPLLSTGSRATFAFTSSAISSNVIITSNNLSNVSPALPSNLGVLTYSSSIKNYSGSGIAYLSDPMVFKNPNGIENYIVKSANVLNFTYVVEQSASLGSATTENSYNEAVVYFNNLSPQSGQVAKIRSYYKSTGVGEYIFSNETDITSFASEAGFTPNTFTASFAIPTTHRNDRLDFKFEFVNPAGLVSKQVLETKNHLFLGGNTYVGGDDNLLTGSLYVAGSTGTGVHISGKGAAAMIRSIGYNGFQRATTTGPGGFVMYSGSVQPLLNASESYSGVGLELVANSESYFKYTTAGNGLLDIRTANFFLGNGANSISGSNGNITISGSNVTVATPTFFLGDSLSYISGSNGNIKIATSKAFSGSKYISFSDYYIYNSGSIILSGSNVNINTPTIQIGTDANYIRAANGQITIASGYGIVGESYQNISDPMDPPVYDLLPVYGNGNILISGSNVDIKTPKFFLGDTTTSISGSNGNIKISGSNVDILTSKFFLGNPNSFISGSGNNIRISGSNVTVSTPSFFLGDSNTSISGSNGNIRISGSNIDLFTDSFFLGNPNTFISGSGNNIRISGSNVTVSTPTFFLGNQTNYISGSGGNISISGSNVEIVTPKFLLGSLDSQYISGSNGNLEISSSTFELNADGQLTAVQGRYRGQSRADLFVFRVVDSDSNNNNTLISTFKYGSLDHVRLNLTGSSSNIPTPLAGYGPAMFVRINPTSIAAAPSLFTPNDRGIPIGQISIHGLNFYANTRPPGYTASAEENANTAGAIVVLEAGATFRIRTGVLSAASPNFPYDAYIAMDSDDVYASMRTSYVSGSDTYTGCITVNTGAQVVLAQSKFAWRIVAMSETSGGPVQFAGGIKLPKIEPYLTSLIITGSELKVTGNVTGSTAQFSDLVTVDSLRLTNLPTSNPGGSGYVWNDGGILKIT